MNAPPEHAPLPRRRVAQGPARPQYLAAAESDRLMMIVTALAGEVSVLRDRLATHEALAETGQRATSQAIEAFVPGPALQARREAERHAMLKRVYRVVTEELDALRQRGHADASATDVGSRPWPLPEGWDKT